MFNHSHPKLQVGVEYDGVVVGNLQPNNTFSVRVDGFGADIPCMTAVGILSGLLGFKTSYLPPMQTKVKMMYSDRNLSFVTGCIPSIIPDPGQQTRYTTGPGAPDYHASQIFSAINNKGAAYAAAHKPPVDIAEGEFQMDNLMGVALTLLRGMSSMSAGDLARVECHLLDDMVRIVSDTFRHYTAFGDKKISNDGGKLNVIWNGTSIDFEAWGLPRPTDPKVNIDPNTKEVNFQGVDGLLDDGRWRFSEYIGWLGNFINLFVTDPVGNVGKIAQDQFRSGKARCHVNNDGSILLQSVADIVLEKVVRIPVPIQTKLENDPTGNKTNTINPNPQLLKTWDPSSSSNIFEMVFQLREYARWLNNTYSLARYGQMNLDYQVPSEAQTPAPDVNSDELDKQAVNAGITNWRYVYSTFRIYRDGSQQHVDGYGNSLTMTSNSFQMASPFDILIQAGGSINMVAGRDINALAQNNIGLTAVTQAVRIKGQTGVMILSVAGHLFLEVLGSYLTKILGNLNINNQINFDGATGDINTLGNTTSQAVFAVDTRLNGDGPHDGHIYIGIPTVASVNGNFQFQTSYGGGQLYETMSQQMMDIGDVSSSGTWSFSTNAVPGKGSPWPGAGITQKTTTAGSTLNQPSSSTVFTSSPAAMTSEPVSIRYQS